MEKEKIKKALWGTLTFVGTTVGGLLLTALFKEEPLPGLLKPKALAAFLGTGVPLWIVLVLLLMLAAIVPRWARSLSKKPKLHVAISPDSCRWEIRQKIDYEVMQVMAGAVFKVTNTKDVVVLVDAYLEKTESFSHFEKPDSDFSGFSKGILYPRGSGTCTRKRRGCNSFPPYL